MRLLWTLFLFSCFFFTSWGLWCFCFKSSEQRLLKPCFTSCVWRWLCAGLRIREPTPPSALLDLTHVFVQQIKRVSLEDQKGVLLLPILLLLSCSRWFRTGDTQRHVSCERSYVRLTLKGSQSCKVAINLCARTAVPNPLTGLDWEACNSFNLQRMCCYGGAASEAWWWRESLKYGIIFICCSSDQLLIRPQTQGSFRAL